MADEVRVRIAPSPTGEPHVGTAYIALFNRCLAKSRGGNFILRIEDTDRERSTPESEKSILETLKWLGLDWDEGPDCGGPYGPYRQSERSDIYREHSEILLQKGWAYKCFCTKAELEAMRAEQMSRKGALGYFGSESPCRRLTPSEISEKEAKGIPYVIRLKVPQDKPEDEVSFFDHTRKKSISVLSREIDDQVLIKTDGYPTYHLANVVDDHLMKITVVMRGEEWISSTYKHILLYRAFGWNPPDFYHLSLLRNADKNKSKISKRKNPVSLRWFRAAGYTPGALLNFLALMGYSRNVEGMTPEEIKKSEIYSMDELISEFDPERISTTGPAFDYDKLHTMNQEYIQKMTVPEFSSYLQGRSDFLIDYLGALVPHVQKRYKRLERETGFWTDFLFKLHLDYTIDDFAKLGVPAAELAKMLQEVRKLFKNGADSIKSVDQFKETVGRAMELLKADSRTLHMALRLAVMGEADSLPLYEAMEALGVYRTMNRFEEAAAYLSARAGK
ncbi:MAG: glutamate--tRNA ligase [Vulcanimicrobiota bacterium]